MPDVTWGQILDSVTEDGGFKLLPPAKYVVRVIKARVKPASTGTLGLGATWRVQVGPEKGGIVHKDFWVDPEDNQQLGNFVRAMKVMGASFANMPAEFEAGLEQIADEIIGSVCVIEVTHRPFNGEPRHEVAPWKVTKYDGPPLSAEDVPDAAPQAPRPNLPQTGSEVPF